MSALVIIAKPRGVETDERATFLRPPTRGAWACRPTTNGIGLIEVGVRDARDTKSDLGNPRGERRGGGEEEELREATARDDGLGV